MVPTRRRLEAAALALALGACGWLPADSPKQPPAQPADTDAGELVHTWTVAAHVLAQEATLTEGEAVGMHGRTVAIQPAGYTSPWHGTCEDAGRHRRKRELADVTAELGVPAAGRKHLANFGLDRELVEYRLICNGTNRTPPITLFIAGAHAMTCFGGVCYMLKR